MLSDYNLTIYRQNRTGSEPVSQAEVKNYIKQDADITAENDLVDDLIFEAVRQAEEITNKQMNTELDMTLVIDIEEADEKGGYVIDLPYTNSAITIDSISAIDYDGDSVVVDSSDYELRGNQLRFKMGNVEGYRFTLEVTNTLPATEQEQFKGSLLALISYKYMNRQDQRANAVTNFLSSHIDYQNWI